MILLNLIPVLTVALTHARNSQPLVLHLLSWGFLPKTFIDVRKCASVNIKQFQVPRHKPGNIQSHGMLLGLAGQCKVEQLSKHLGC
jgi:hypothetical protein